STRASPASPQGIRRSSPRSCVTCSRCRQQCARGLATRPDELPKSAGRGRPSRAGSWSSSSSSVIASMGEAQKLPWQEQIRLAREQFEAARDFELAVEDEFAILDPDTLSLVNRFEELQEAARGTELEAHLVGELIASEVEV